MKVNSINSQNQNFKGSLTDKFVSAAAKHPLALTALAGSSVIAQKIVMSGSEATIAPLMDLAIGKTITKVTKEKDDRTMQSSKVQAVRTSAQAIGGTIVGIIVRGACIASATALLAKAGEKAGSKIADIINPDKLSPNTNAYKFSENASKWGKNIGGAVAIGVMMFTNFLVDAPFINWINKKFSHALKMDISEDNSKKAEVKEAK